MKRLNLLHFFIPFSILFLIFVVACNDNKSAAKSEGGAERSLQEGIEFPVVPDSITDELERVKYISRHFWDNMDFNDTVLVNNEAFIEQSFSNYVYLLSALPDSVSVAESVGILLDKASANKTAYNKIFSTAALYLGDPNSPLRQEELWLVFLNGLKDRPLTEESARERILYEIEMHMKNRVGTKAADFKYEDRSGANSSLYATKPAPLGMMLIFYDPDCDHCKEILGQLRNHPSLNALIDAGQINVLAVDTEDNKDLWNQTKADMPANWSVAFNTDGIHQRDVYALPVLPVIYVLDPQFNILVKDPSLDRLDGWFNSLVTAPPAGYP